MRNKQISLFIFITILSCALRAQNAVPPTFTVKGVVIDSLTNDTEPYATIRIVPKAAPVKPIKMAVTDNNGKFQEKFAAAPGTYIITITSVAKNPIIKEFQLEAGKTTVDFGTLYATDATNELKGVEVVAQKPLVKVDVDKIEYSVEDDPDSKTNTLLEMLRKVPLVTVDGEDKVQVNGSSSFKIHVNGKPNSMMSNNPTEVLKSMPANTIKNIEVITSPGAKYDAEGVGGILNIITVGGGFEGYTATFSGRAGNRGLGGSLYATVKKEKLTLSGNYNYSLNKNPKSYSSGTTEYYDSVDQKYLESNSERKGNGAFQYGNLEASYEIDTLRLITVSAGLWGGGNDSDGLGYTGMYNATHTIEAYGYDVNSAADYSWYSIRGSMDYQRTSKRNKKRMWTFSYKIDTEPSDRDVLNAYAYKNIAQVPKDIRRPNTNTTEHTNTTEQTFQADFTTPIGKIHTVETGVKYIIRDNVSESDYYEAEPGKPDYVQNEGRSSHYKHLNDILAAYFGYTLRYKKFSVKPGLRYEHTSQDVRYSMGKGTNFEKTFNDLVPSVSLGWKVGMTQNLSASYNMRIYRPGIRYLNPYFDDQNPMSISQGNPELDSEKGHSFNLGYGSFTPKLNLNFSLRHSFNNNSIEEISRLYKDETTLADGNVIPAGAIYSTYANIGKSQRTGLSVYLRWTTTPKTIISLNASGDYTDLKSPTQKLHNYGWSGSAYAGIQHTFPWKLRASVNAGGSTPSVSLQGNSSGYQFYSLGLNRSFLKEDRLTVSVNCSNLFSKYNSYNYKTEGPNFSQKNYVKYPSRYYEIRIGYRIGKLQAAVKKTARSISNDDVKSGGGGEGGGGGQGGN